MPSAAGRRRRAVGSRAVSRSSWLCRVRSSSRARSTAWRDRASTNLSDSSARPTALCKAAQRGVMVEIGTAVLGKFQTGQKRPGSSPAITPRQFDETSPLRLEVPGLPSAGVQGNAVLISTCSMAAPRSNNELNGTGRCFLGVMPCASLRAILTTPEERACLGTICPGLSAIRLVQNRTLNSIIFSPCSASRSSSSVSVLGPSLAECGSQHDAAVTLKH